MHDHPQRRIEKFSTSKHKTLKKQNQVIMNTFFELGVNESNETKKSLGIADTR
ncbi:hypothetical protein L291_1016 [Acinetobacter guillouiae MSP4-18]|nr:hypothetical protein L291_1016 [Acinetobacter guillouiae MSP4-18]